MTPEVLTQLAEDWIPFNKFLGVKVIAVAPGDVVLEIPYRDELIGDPQKRAIHGGVISMLADTSGGLALWSAIEQDRSISTIDLRVDYLRPGRQEAIRAHATLVRAGKTVGVSDVRLFHPSQDTETIATGKGVYAIRLPRAS